MTNLKISLLMLGAIAILAATPGIAATQDPPPSEAPPPDAGEGATITGPPTIDSDDDGKMDAWDRDGNGVADLWDLDGDGRADAMDGDGDGVPEIYRSGYPKPDARAPSAEPDSAER